MCCYNNEEYISFAIESVLNQTFSDFEFIIVDDGSIDKSKEIILSYNDKRIKYIYQENRGCGAACYRGCREATGKYIARMDSDDVCEKNRFEEQIRFLENHADYILVASACTYIDENDRVTGRSFPYTTNSNIKQILLLLHSLPIAHPAIMFRRASYEKSGGYIGLKFGEDFFLWNKMATFGKYKNIKKCLLRYRKTSSSITATIERKAASRLIKKIVDMMNQTTITAADIEACNQIYLKEKEKTPPSYMRDKRSIEEKIYCFLVPVAGSSMAETFTYFLKNLYGMMRLLSKHNYHNRSLLSKRSLMAICCFLVSILTAKLFS
jgi:glycosyltransferase involved in cell wall biosynthesis